MLIWLVCLPPIRSRWLPSFMRLWGRWQIQWPVQFIPLVVVETNLSAPAQATRQQDSPQLSPAEVADHTIFVEATQAVAERLLKNISLHDRFQIIAAQPSVKKELTDRLLGEQVRRLLEKELAIFIAEANEFHDFATGLTANLPLDNIQVACDRASELVMLYRRLAEEFCQWLAGLDQAGVEPIWHRDQILEKSLFGDLPDDYDRLMSLSIELRAHAPKGYAIRLLREEQLGKFANRLYT